MDLYGLIYRFVRFCIGLSRTFVYVIDYIWIEFHVSQVVMSSCSICAHIGNMDGSMGLGVSRSVRAVSQAVGRELGLSGGRAGGRTDGRTGRQAGR